MLNYLTVVTQDIKQTKNRMLLDDTYNALYNSMHLEAIDNKTQGYTKNLADIIFSLKMSKIKRERIEFILEQEKAGAMKQAIPNPVALLSLTQAKSKYELLASIVYMAMDSTAGYNAAISNANMDYLKSGWEIDDNELADINTLNGLLWDYKNEMRREYNIPSDLILNEEKIIDFVKNKNYDNVDGKILFFEKNKETYQGYPMLWLILAQCYYEKATKYNNNSNSNEAVEYYNKCLEAIKKYENNNARIFVKDSQLAKIIPLIITSAQQIKNQSEYIELAKHYLEILEKNMKNSDWDLQYFAAQTYIDIYSETKDKEFLDKAYEKVKSNVAYLVPEQRALNAEYSKEEYEELKADEGSTKKEKDEIKKYNEQRKKEWEKELPPIMGNLELNLQLLFDLSKIKNIDDAEKENIDHILHTKGERLFLCYPLDDIYWFNLPQEFRSVNYASEIHEVKNDTFHIPVWYVYAHNVNDFKITYEKGSEQKIYDSGYHYWVNRKAKDVKIQIQKSENGKLSNIDFKVDKNTTIQFEFNPLGKSNTKKYITKFKNNGKPLFWNGFEKVY